MACPPYYSPTIVIVLTLASTRSAPLIPCFDQSQCLLGLMRWPSELTSRKTVWLATAGFLFVLQKLMSAGEKGRCQSVPPAVAAVVDRNLSSSLSICTQINMKKHDEMHKSSIEDLK